MKKISDLLKYGLGLSNDLSSREKLRQLLLEAEKKTSFTDVLVFYPPYQLHHYKKERLYDKAFIKENYLKSVAHIAFERQEDIIEDTELIRWDTDLLTGEIYNKEKTKKVYAYSSTTGVIMYYQNKVEDPMFYDDYFRLLSILVFDLLTKQQEVKSLDHQKRLYQAVYQSELMAYRIIENNLMRFNKQALRWFELSKTYVYYSIYSRI